MRVLIKGCDAIEINNLRGKKQLKHFLKTTEQLYKIYPDGLRRCRIRRDYITIIAKP